MNPSGGMKVLTDQQPITLVVENASTNGARPLSYVFEVATDAAFTSTVFTREGITPGEGSSTSLRLPDPLAPERGYFWRARAQDGANTGPFSGPANFTVVTPIVIGQPTLVSPGTNAVLNTLRPKLVFTNAPRSTGRPITYLIEERRPTVSRIRWGSNVPEQPNQTSVDVPQDLAIAPFTSGTSALRTHDDRPVVGDTGVPDAAGATATATATADDTNGPWPRWSWPWRRRHRTA
jgi:hypothetical protein